MKEITSIVVSQMMSQMPSHFPTSLEIQTRCLSQQEYKIKPNGKSDETRKLEVSEKLINWK